MRGQEKRLFSRCGIAILASITVLGASGCSLIPGFETSASEETQSAAPYAVSESQAPVEVALQPEASASDNLPFFTQTIQSVWNSEQSGVGQAYFSALSTAGFDPAAIERTNDTTAIGHAADTFSIAVAWHDGQCLIGQVGVSTGEPVTAVASKLGSGGCLIGAVLRGE